MRPCGRSGDGCAASARRQRHLRRPGAHGAAVGDAVAPGRRSRQFRVARCGTGRDALHRVPDGPSRGGDDRGSGRGRRRFQAELRRQGHRTRGVASGPAEPLGQRRLRDRGGNGHQHRPAQPPGGGLRAEGAPEGPGGLPGGADAAPARTRFPQRGEDNRP